MNRCYVWLLLPFGIRPCRVVVNAAWISLTCLLCALLLTLTRFLQMELEECVGGRDDVRVRRHGGAGASFALPNV